MSDLSAKLFRIATMSPEDMKAEILELAALQQIIERRRKTSRQTSARWRAKCHRDSHGDSHGDGQPSVTVTVTGSDCISSTNTHILNISKKDKLQASSKPKVDRGTRLPATWEPSPTDYKFALDAGLTPDQVAKEAASFLDYWIGVPGAKGVKLNWPATWRNRIRMVAPRIVNKISAKPKSANQLGWENIYDKLERAGSSVTENYRQGGYQLGPPDPEIIPAGKSSNGGIHGGAGIASVSIFDPDGSTSTDPF